MFSRNLTFRVKILLILSTVIIVLVGNILLLTLPKTKGFFTDDLHAPSIMAFNSIDYKLQSGYHLLFDEGGFILPIQTKDNPLGIVIYAKGDISYQDDVYQTDNVFIFLHEKEYYCIMGDLTLVGSDEVFFIKKTKSSSPYILASIPSLETPIGKKYYPLTEKQGNIIISLDAGFSNLTNLHHSSLKKPYYFLAVLIYISFAIAMLFIILILTDRRPLEKMNRSLDTRKVNYRSINIALSINALWLTLLSFNANMYITQIILIVGLVYLLYELIYVEKILATDLRLINFTKTNFIFLPLAISLLTFLLFGNTSITLQQVNQNFTLEGAFYMLTSFLWLFFISFSFIPYICRETGNSKFEHRVIIIYNIIFYLLYNLTTMEVFNLTIISNAVLFIPIYTYTLNNFSKRVYNFLPPFLTIILANFLISVIR